MSNVFLSSTLACQYFADILGNNLTQLQPLAIERKTFGDGERYLRFKIDEHDQLVGKDVLIVGQTHTDEDFLEIVRIGNALADLGTNKRIFVMPFFGYSTMEKALKPGEVTTAKIQARLLSSIPNCGGGNYFLFLDLHSGGIINYFEGDSVRFELTSEPLLVKAISKLSLDNLVMASADLGRPILIQRLAQNLHADLAFISKARDFDKTKVLAVVGDVKGKNVVIYDDMARSGSTLIKAAKTYRDQGAKQVFAVLSHLAVNNEGVTKQLAQSSLTQIITTNSHPASQLKSVSSSKFSVVDVAPLFVEVVKSILDPSTRLEFIERARSG